MKTINKNEINNDKNNNNTWRSVASRCVHPRGYGRGGACNGGGRGGSARNRGWWARTTAAVGAAFLAVAHPAHRQRVASRGSGPQYVESSAPQASHPAFPRRSHSGARGGKVLRLYRRSPVPSDATTRAKASNFSSSTVVQSRPSAENCACTLRIKAEEARMSSSDACASVGCM